jgi:hypothetical protein
MTRGQVRCQVQVNAQAGDRVSLVQALYDKAAAFYGDEEFELEGAIKVEPSTEVSNIEGKSLAVMWEGDAWFISTKR